MKREIRRLAALVLALLLAMALAAPGFAAGDGKEPERLLTAPDGGALMQSSNTAPVYGKYYQTEARSMLDMINSFRTGGEAWVWNSDSSTKTAYPAGTLQALTYDYTLEQIAMQRAAELVVRYQTSNYIEHQRPNGGNCFSLTINGVSSYGENIACGQQSADQVYMAWREDNEPYEGQGHRRNMLRTDCNTIGIACFEYNGRKYWVQEFGISNSGAAATEAIDSGRQVPVEYDADEFPDFHPISGPPPSGGGGGDGVTPAPADGQDQNLPQLATPTELAWGKNWHGTTFDSLPGAASWKYSSPHQGQFRVVYYRVESDGDKEVTRTTWHLGSEKDGAYFSSTQFIWDDYPSGTYYYTVQAMADGTQYRNSDIARSANWQFAAPTAKLPVPTGLSWTEDGKMTVAAPDNPNALGTMFYIYIRDESAKGYDGVPDGWRFAGSTSSRDFTAAIYDYALQTGGSGYYAFRVRYLSGDVTQIRTGAWSGLSEPRWFGDGDPGTPPDVPSDNPLDDALSDIEKLDQNASAAAKQAAVETAEAALKETGAQTLKENLLTDTEGSGTTQKLIEKAEELKGNKAQPKAATDGLDAAAQQQLTQMAQGTEIVGAGLNTDADSVELRIGKPDPDANLVVPAQYGNAVEIKMDLFANGENITAGHQELDVPVKITMPVPAGINPEFLVILHHRADGTINEILRPHIFRGGDGKDYATFVISSFSDFTFAEAQVTAKRTGTGVDVTVTVPDEAAAATSSVVCAVYDTNGKMLGSGLGQFTGGTLNFSIACDSAKAAAVKVFFLGSGSAPVIASIAVEPE